jgi:hypothetical protein
MPGMVRPNCGNYFSQSVLCRCKKNLTVFNLQYVNTEAAFLNSGTLCETAVLWYPCILVMVLFNSAVILVMVLFNSAVILVMVLFNSAIILVNLWDEIFVKNTNCFSLSQRLYFLSSFHPGPCVSLRWLLYFLAIL